jgi:branched-chain amino acid transport system substrate-binding protein
MVKVQLLATAVASLWAMQAHADDVVVRIGHVAALSGGAAHFGKDNENGARLAVEDLNAKGVMIGGKKAKFELVTEDDAADPKQATSAAQRLVDLKVNGVIGHLTSGTSIPASRLYAQAGIPQIAASVTNPQYTRQGFKTTFRVVADDVQLGQTLGRYAVLSLKAKRIVVIDDRTAYGQGLADEFEKGTKSAGGNVVKHEFTNDKATDLMGILTAIKAAHPDVIFYGGMDAVGGPLARQMKQLGIRARLMGGDGMCSRDIPRLAGGMLGNDELICAEAGGIDGKDATGAKAMDDFKARFQKRFNIGVDLYAPYTYDATMLMAQAMEKAGSADPAKYLPVLAKTTNYKGVTGTISFDEKGDIKNGALTLYTYRGGNKVALGVIR